MQRAPMYRVIYDDIAEQIHTGALAPAEQLPNEHELAKRYGVSRMTVRQAMEHLGADDYVARRRGLGTFVRDGVRRGRRLNRLRSFTDDLAAGQGVLTSTVVRCELAGATADVALALQLDPGDEVNRLTRVRLVDGEPAALQDAWVPYAVAPGLVREPLLGGSLYRTLTEKHAVTLRWADHSMTAALLGPEEAALLHVEPGGAVLLGERTTWSDDDRPVEFTYGWTLPSWPLLLRIETE